MLAAVALAIGTFPFRMRRLRLEIQEAEAATVQAFSRCTAKGYSLKAIVKSTECRACGYPSRSKRETGCGMVPECDSRNVAA